MNRVETIGNATAIYALCEYPSWRPRYIGKTTQYLHERHKAHIRDAKRGATRPVNYWLRKQIASNKRLAIKLIEYAGSDWADRERFWIAHYRLEQPDLLNICDGGEGLAGYIMPQPHKDKIAAALRTGQHFNCETCSVQFWRKQRDIKKGNNRFCSRPCYAASLKGVSRPVPSHTTQKGIVAAAAARRARTHCKRNHPLSGDNLFLTPVGGRGCKECRKIHKRTYLEKSRG